MALRTVVVEVTTEKREFPVGTVSTKFLFELFNSAGLKLSSLETDVPGVSFPSVPEADDYEVRVTANGVTVKQIFDIPVTTVFLDVPVSVTVQF